ncbi:hypothetical protein BU16DRAFT_539416 [Lophium mytilinum]|uniref:Uncharacterized protein n=1 Tax=Lophium mytilinum TaxID=390894 RepID=A0A6A6QSR9_9PEZI|nr:hypothetical protein BU16DRAFT_539416 [Lophium mytilinum]
MEGVVAFYSPTRTRAPERHVRDDAARAATISKLFHVHSVPASPLQLPAAPLVGSGPPAYAVTVTVTVAAAGQLAPAAGGAETADDAGRGEGVRQGVLVDWGWGGGMTAEGDLVQGIDEAGTAGGRGEEGEGVQGVFDEENSSGVERGLGIHDVLKVEGAGVGVVQGVLEEGGGTAAPLLLPPPLWALLDPGAALLEGLGGGELDVPAGGAGAEVAVTKVVGADCAGEAVGVPAAEEAAGVAVATQAHTALAEACTLSAVATPQPLMTQAWAEAWSWALLTHWHLKSSALQPMAEPAERRQGGLRTPQAGILATTEAHCAWPATEDAKAKAKAAMMVKDFMLKI